MRGNLQNVTIEILTEYLISYIKHNIFQIIHDIT
jgi:hypothetical protein